jgi:hypothetical protein
VPSLHPLQLKGGVCAITNLSAACAGQAGSTCDLLGTSDFGQRSQDGLRLRPTLLMVPVALIISAVAVMLGPSPFAHHARLEASRGKPHIGKKRKPCYMG